MSTWIEERCRCCGHLCSWPAGGKHPRCDDCRRLCNPSPPRVCAVLAREADALIALPHGPVAQPVKPKAAPYGLVRDMGRKPQPAPPPPRPDSQRAFRIKAVVPTAPPASRRDPEAHAHHYKFPSPDGAQLLTGVCACGATQTLPAYEAAGYGRSYRKR